MVLARLKKSGGLHGWEAGRLGGWVDGWLDVKAGLSIAYSNQKDKCLQLNGWLQAPVRHYCKISIIKIKVILFTDFRVAHVKDSSNTIFGVFNSTPQWPS